MVRQDVLGEPVPLEGALQHLEDVAGPLAGEPLGAHHVARVVVDGRVEVDETEALDDDPVHDVDLPAVVGLGVLEVMIRLERLGLSAVFPVLAQGPPDRLTVDLDALLLQEVTNLSAAPPPPFSLEAEDRLLHRGGCRCRAPPGLVAEALGPELLVAVNPVLDLGSGELVLTGGLGEGEVPREDRQDELQPRQNVGILEHRFHAGHRRGQGDGLVSIAPGTIWSYKAGTSCELHYT